MMSLPTVGRIVLFCRGLRDQGVVARAGEEVRFAVFRAAIVTARLSSDRVNLQVLTDGIGGVYSDGCSQIQSAGNVQHSGTATPGTWSWPHEIHEDLLDGLPFPIAAAKRASATSVKSPHEADALGGDGEVSRKSIPHTDTAAS